MIKLKNFFNYDKEEKYLENMLAKGYKLTKKIGFIYIFEKNTPTKQNIRIDYRKFKKNSDFIDYITLFNDCGWEHLCGTRKSRLQYFASENNNKNINIFCSNTERAERYLRRLRSNLFLTIVYTYYFFIFDYYDSMNLLSKVFNPKSFFLTPGLWEMSGDKFRTAILFEAPFAIFFRIIPGYFLMAIILYLLFLNINTVISYYKTKTDL